MTSGKTARRYAKAAYDAARDVGIVEAVLADMEALGRAWRGSAALRRFLSNPAVSRTHRTGALEALFRKGVDPLTWRLLTLLASKRRTGLLGEVCEAFRDWHERAMGIVNVHLETAFPLPEEDVQELAAPLRRRIAGTVQMNVRVAPALIGGIRYWVGDVRHDHSLRGALESLRRRFLPSEPAWGIPA